MNIPTNITELRHRLQVQKRFIDTTTILVDKAKAEVAVMEAQLLDLFPPVEVVDETPESGEVESRAGGVGLTGEVASAQTELKADQYEHDMATGDATAIGGVDHAPNKLPAKELSQTEPQQASGTLSGDVQNIDMTPSGAAGLSTDNTNTTMPSSGNVPQDEAKPDPANAADAMAKATQTDPAQS